MANRCPRERLGACGSGWRPSWPPCRPPLATASAVHPLVNRVVRVEAFAEGMHVCIAYRTPVLAVARRGTDGPLRAVDGDAILLPLVALTAGLPLLDNEVPPPAGAAGFPW